MYTEDEQNKEIVSNTCSELLGEGKCQIMDK